MVKAKRRDHHEPYTRYIFSLNLDETTIFSKSSIFVISVKFTDCRIKIMTSSDIENNNYFFCRNFKGGNRLNNVPLSDFS